MNDIETLAPLELNKLMESGVCEFLKILYEGSEFYRETLRKIGYKYTDCFDLEMFQKIPIMSKPEMKKIGFDKLSVKDNGRIKIRSTSGTSGQPFVFPKDAYAAKNIRAAVYHAYGWHGIDLGYKQGRFWGTPIKRKAYILQKIQDRLFNRRRFSAFVLEDSKMLQFWNTLKKFKPQYFYGYPNVIAAFSKYLLENNIKGSELDLKVIICTGEMLLPIQREIIKEAFGCSIANEYGSTENGLIAFECPKGGMHVMNHNIFLECVDDQHNPVKKGEVGTFIITEFHSRSLPFLRYKLNDRGRLPENECACGRPFPLIDIELGREDSFIVTPDGKKVYDSILAYTFKDYFDCFQGIQETPDMLLIKYVCSKKLGQRDFENLENGLRHYLGNRIKIKYQPVEKILAEPSGKLRYFITKLGK